jgi:hypothetical protein
MEDMVNVSTEQATGTPNTEQAQSTPAGQTTEQTTTTTQNNEQVSFPNIDPTKLDPALQATYKSMQSHLTKVSQEAAPFRKLAEQVGGLDNLNRAIQLMQQLDTDPRAFYQQLGQYLTPQQAQAIQQQAQEPDNPYKDEDWFKAAVAEAKKQMEAEIGPVKQFYTQQQREALHNQAKAKFGEVANYAPGLNIDNPADPFWKTMADLGLPPTHADWGASIAKYGSVQSFVEALKPRIIAQYQEEVRKKSNVSSTLTSAGAQQAVQSKSLNEMDIDELFNGMAEIQAAKAARLGQQF